MKISFISRFDNLSKNRKDKLIGLNYRIKAMMLKSTADLTNTQIESLNTIVDLGSKQTDLEEQKKQALSKINIKPQ